MKLKKIISIYLSGFLAGVALVLYPAAGSIFTDPVYHGFTNSQFGSIFLPQIILAIMASLSAPKIAEKIGMKKVLLYGLWALLISMLSLTASHWLMLGNIDYYLIMVGTGMLGVGFGFTITALNPFAYALFPGKETSAVTAMHILLGLGTASSALLLSMFLNQGFWYGASTLIAALLLGMIVFTSSLELQLPETTKEEVIGNKTIPVRIWLYGLGVFLYGACEATFGSWGALFLEKEGGLSIAKAALGLSLFWMFITIGRVILTVIALRFSTKWVFVIAPFVLAIIFYLLPTAHQEVVLLAFMAMAGLAMSFLFPKSISSATDEYPLYAPLISGIMVAALQLGTGISANIIGSLSEIYSISSLFQFSTIYALFFGILILYLSITQKNLKM